MSATVRFLFDECVGKPVMLDVHRATGTAHPFTHVIDYLGKGAKDRTWVPRLAEEGGWVVITADGGKNSVKGDKLPALCLEFGVMHVLLSSKLHQFKSREKAAVLCLFWGEIETAVAAPQSIRYLLSVKDQRGRSATVKFQLRPVPIDPPATPDEADRAANDETEPPPPGSNE